MAESKRPLAKHRGESLLSPVTDTGYWPYDRLNGVLAEDLTNLNEPDDSLGVVPRYSHSGSLEEDF